MCFLNIFTPFCPQTQCVQNYVISPSIYFTQNSKSIITFPLSSQLWLPDPPLPLPSPTDFLNNSLCSFFLWFPKTPPETRFSSASQTRFSSNSSSFLNVYIMLICCSKSILLFFIKSHSQNTHPPPAHSLTAFNADSSPVSSTKLSVAVLGFTITH